MKRYLLSIYQPDGPPPADVDLERVMADVDALLGEMKAAGAWVFNGGLHNGGLHAASTATVVRPRDEDVLMVDGPYLEGKEHIGGLVVVDAPDLDAALDWGRKAARAIGLPIEIRPFREEADR